MSQLPGQIFCFGLKAVLKKKKKKAFTFSLCRQTNSLLRQPLVVVRTSFLCVSALVRTPPPLLPLFVPPKFSFYTNVLPSFLSCIISVFVQACFPPFSAFFVCTSLPSFLLAIRFRLTKMHDSLGFFLPVLKRESLFDI